MRLRYLHLADVPPLRDVRIVFRQETVLSRACAIHFVVGVNATGKTRLLQALTSAFLSLERGRFPMFPITLAYDLGQGDRARTILLHKPQEGADSALLLEFEGHLDNRSSGSWEALATTSWDAGPLFEHAVRSRFLGGDLPGIGSIGAFLPSTILAYTSGAIESWQEIFAPSPAAQDVGDLPPIAPGDESLIEERPPNWSLDLEIAFQREQGNVEQADALERAKRRSWEEASLPSMCHLMTADALPLAVCAMALHHTAQEFQGDITREILKAKIEQSALTGERMPGLRGLMNEVEWLWPESIQLRINFSRDLLRSPEAKPHRAVLQKIYELAATATPRPEPSTERLLSFDLFRAVSDESDGIVAHALVDAFEKGPVTPFTVFERLAAWREIGLLTGLNMVVRKRLSPNLLLYDWLSDGERMFLGRTALFHLLRGEDDALIILDEPETHFNDTWKREVVDIIDDSLRDDASEVVISTHSSIALTDAFDTEITLLRKSPEDGEIAVVRTPMQTFGASPSEIMRGIFGAEDVVGQRATEFLDMVLMVAAFPEEVEAVWQLDGDLSTWQDTSAFRTLWENVLRLPHRYEGEERLAQTLHGVRQFARQVTGRQEITAQEALEVLQDRLGPGYYHFEFRRRLRSLRQSDDNAAQDTTA